jgi:hypothetical protein
MVDEEGFMRVWAENEKEMRARAIKIVGRADANDILQDVFAYSYPHREKLDERLAQYLMRSVSNRSYSFKGALARRTESRYDYKPVTIDKRTPYEDLRMRERESYYEQNVEPLLAELNAKHREALERYTRIKRGGPKIPRSTLRSRREWAMKYLRKKLGVKA